MFEHRKPPELPTNTQTRAERLQNEVQYETARSGGPGGQNVNKVETKARLLFDLWKSDALTFEQKGILARDSQIQSKFNSDGMIVFTSQEHRTQLANKEKAFAKFIDAIELALTPKAERVTDIPSETQDRIDRERRHEKEVRSSRLNQRRTDRWSDE